MTTTNLISANRFAVDGTACFGIKPEFISGVETEMTEEENLKSAFADIIEYLDLCNPGDVQSLHAYAHAMTDPAIKGHLREVLMNTLLRQLWPGEKEESTEPSVDPDEIKESSPEAVERTLSELKEYMENKNEADDVEEASL